ncbi:hypothetical protein MY3296_000930 [Beauveria thailandica]
MYVDAGQNAASASSTALHITFPLRRSAPCASSPCALTAPSITAANLSTNATNTALVQLSINARLSAAAILIPLRGAVFGAVHLRGCPRPRIQAAPLRRRPEAPQPVELGRGRARGRWWHQMGKFDVQAVLRGGGEEEAGFEEAGFALDVDECVDNPREQRRGGILPIASERPRL